MKSFRENQKATFFLRGGIGNQLLIYFAGKKYEQDTGFSVKFDASLIDSARMTHQSSIRNLLLPTGGTGSSAFTVRSSSAFSLAISRIIQLGFSLNLTNFYKSPAVGYDGELNKTSSKKILGYFQSWRHLPFTAQGEDCERLVLRTSNSDFAELVNRAAIECPIVVHVRRGDYLHLGNTIGLLGRNYYREAIDLAIMEVGRRPVWVFSDDISQASELLSPIRFGNHFVYFAAEQLSDEETLVLMSHGLVNVIANSTFSLIAAATNPSAKKVIFPKPWFKGESTPLDLTPPHWVGIQSDFT